MTTKSPWLQAMAGDRGGRIEVPLSGAFSRSPSTALQPVGRGLGQGWRSHPQGLALTGVAYRYAIRRGERERRATFQESLPSRGTVAVLDGDFRRFERMRKAPLSCLSKPMCPNTPPFHSLSCHSNHRNRPTSCGTPQKGLSCARLRTCGRETVHYSPFQHRIAAHRLSWY